MKSINMKTRFVYILTLFLAASAVSCEKDLPSGKSILVDPVVEKTEFDLWLDRHYIEPYNIRFEYRLPDKESHFGYWVTPPPLDKSIEVAKVVKYATLDAMTELMASEDPEADPTLFAKEYFPKVLYLVGSYEIDFSGKVVLGSAENGLQINLLGVTYFDRNAPSVPGLLLHEFMHILDGRNPVSSEYRAIGGSDYVGDGYTSADHKYLEKGFLSNYARSSVAEDIAVTGGALIGETAEWWEENLSKAGEEGRAKLETKREILKAWLRDSYGVDVDKWNEIYMRRMASLDNIDWDDLED